jgi:hypothetical protein
MCYDLFFSTFILLKAIHNKAKSRRKILNPAYSVGFFYCFEQNTAFFYLKQLTILILDFNCKRNHFFTRFLVCPFFVGRLLDSK